jgi:chemotaxis signal transduction protein
VRRYWQQSRVVSAQKQKGASIQAERPDRSSKASAGSSLWSVEEDWLGFRVDVARSYKRVTPDDIQKAPDFKQQSEKKLDFRL